MTEIGINPARIDFVTLRLFCAVVQAGSITKGAAHCHLALSAASRRLADFESATGSRLLDRSAQGVRLTQAGHVALQHAMRLTQGFELFGAELADYSEGFRGQIRLWANMSALSQVLPDVLARFMTAHPDIKVDVEEQLSGDIVRALIDELADIGVLADGTPVDGLETAPFQADRLVVICSRQHPLAQHRRLPFRDCLAHAFVGLNRGASLLELISAAARREGLPLRLRVQVRSFGAMCRMVGANLGIGILPATACAPFLAPYGLKAIRLTDDWSQRRLLVARRVDRPLTAAAAALWTTMANPSPGARTVS
jgi:DNA-binding transcriptional LysR family regulator